MEVAGDNTGDTHWEWQAADPPAPATDPTAAASDAEPASPGAGPRPSTPSTPPSNVSEAPSKPPSLARVQSSASSQATVVGSPLHDKYRAVITPLGDDAADLFTSIVLSMWDNIVGPRVRQVWLGDPSLPGNFYDRLLPFLAKCTLNGEISREQTGGLEAEHKFYVLKELGYAMSTFIFTSHVGPDAVEPNLFSLSLVIPLAKLETYLQIHQLCTERLRSLLKKLQVLLRSHDTEVALGLFTTVLKPFLAEIRSLGLFSVHVGLDMASTIFDPSNSTKFEVPFLRRAVTSHLQTGGVTVVLGADPTLINMMINSLAVFLSSAERRLSRYTSKERQPYAPDLFLQGITLDDELREVEPLEIVQSQRPSTVINLDAASVKQTKPFNEYSVIRADAEQEELQRLEGSTAENVAPQLFHDVLDKSALVRTLLSQVFTPHSAGVREAILNQFKRSLMRKALVIIQLVDSCLATTDSPLKAEALRGLKRSLQCTGDYDFKLVLAAAEKLRPGMFLTVMGDPAVKQNNLFQLLNAF